MKQNIIFLSALLALQVVIIETQSTVSINLSNTTHYPHYWEKCVGSGHATLTLRSDWRDQLIQAKNDLGFQFVRFHGLLDDDMSTCKGPGQYSFYNIDQSFDFLVSQGMKPLIELSFMPTALASANATIMHYKANINPPNNWQD